MLMTTPIPNYRKRSGVTTLFKTIQYLCKIFGLYHTSIVNWVSSVLHGPDLDFVLGWLNNLQAICLIIDGLPDD